MKLWRVRNRIYRLDSPTCPGWIILTDDNLRVEYMTSASVEGKPSEPAFWQHNVGNFLAEVVLHERGSIVSSDEEE